MILRVNFKDFSSILKMVTGLALIGMLHALTIDSQLTVIKNDCYERLAIGQRLRPKDVYKTVKENTVKNCQMACTQEKELCKAFSFGIGVKGNATCELSAFAVKESADLKPLGTIANTDFDLYIKKLGCSLVIAPIHGTHNHHDEHSPADPETPHPIINHHNSDSYESSQQNYPIQEKPLDNNYGQPSNIGAGASGVEEHHVQTLVSISTGPHSVLHPVHEILIGEGPYTYGYARPPHKPTSNSGEYGNRPPFRPQLHFKPEPDHRPDYDSRPSESYTRPQNHRPPLNEYLYDDVDRYDSRPSRPQRPERPQRPQGTDEIYGGRPQRPQRPGDGYDGSYRPQINQRPEVVYDRPHRPQNPSRPEEDYDRPQRPQNTPRPNEGYDRPQRPENHQTVGGGYDRPQHPQIHQRPEENYDRPQHSQNLQRPNENYSRPERPQRPAESYGNIPNKPINADNPNGGSYGRPSTTNNKPSSYENVNNIKGFSTEPKDPHAKPIVSQSVDRYGQPITSIITELKEACFRRVLAGKRVTRAFVKRSLICERIEDCQRECADENQFACEGFNYRLDPAGYAKGECELLDLPLSRLDLGRDVYPDSDYDYYERDRNSAIQNCNRGWSGGQSWHHQSSGGGYDNNYNYHHQDDNYDRRRRPYYNYHPSDRRKDNRRPDYDRNRPDSNWYDNDDDGYKYGRPTGSNRRGDFAYHHSHHSQQSYEHSQNFNHFSQGGHNYLPPTNHRPPPPYDYKSYEPYLPPGRVIHKYYLDRERDKDYWGFNKEKWGSYGGSYGQNWLGDRGDYGDLNRKYLPPKVDGGMGNPGKYGGSYGHGGHGHSYWGNNHQHQNGGGNNGGLLPPYQSGGGAGGYLPQLPYKPIPPIYLPPKLSPPTNGGSYLPKPINPPINGGGSYLPELSTGNYLPISDNIPNAILPAEPRYPPYNYVKDECSLRTATGFRLHKGIVKKFFEVPSLYECEMLCFKEKEFLCASYAYRYTVSSSAPTDNCYLSNRNYKELDFYTDLQPDRDFDLYTMNNNDRCKVPLISSQGNSECFWRVRSAQRLDHIIVRDSLLVKSIVECQIECLKSSRFTCRAFSFRYVSPMIGGIIDNCQLTDWPYYELDPTKHFVPEPGFEVYERGSYGHGCEPNHFGIRGKPWQNERNNADQLCYIGFGSPARLLPQATKKAIRVVTELDCKTECSKHREGTLFQCMSFSYRSDNHHGGPNCHLSDILQRDLLPHIDYVPDPDSWLFAWDNYNPHCVDLPREPHHHNSIGGRPVEELQDRFGYHHLTALDTWRVYSVSGWPCRRGSVCKENKEAGFWFCELETTDKNNWDYCCRPNHQCGYSEGFLYQWCYVGPSRSQWRKCNDKYYPYHNYINDRIDHNYRPIRPHNEDHWPILPPKPIRDEWPRPGGRPDRPLAPPKYPPPRPSLAEYEMEFDSQFLDPPKPGGFGQPRHWPVSYLHKERPPNASDISTESSSMSEVNPKFAAIQSLIDVIKSNDLKNLQYQITNDSNKEDDILFVRIPLPTNFAQQNDKNDTIPSASVLTDVVKAEKPSEKPIGGTSSKNRSQKSIPTEKILPVPVYRRGYITRTNVTKV